MVRWHVDIMPCNACDHNKVFDICSKKHKVMYVDGCGDCGIAVNAKWYQFDEECPDFEQRYFSDPSGS